MEPQVKTGVPPEKISHRDAEDFLVILCASVAIYLDLGMKSLRSG
jgi:hypothetical protein